MSMSSNKNSPAKLVQEWQVPNAATFGSSVRSRGILLEILSRLPSTVKKSLGIKGGVLTLSMPEDATKEFRSVSAVVSKALEDIESLPIIPREIEDILSIKTAERHRWLKDSRLQSAGTRTVRLRGRAKQVTFHIFDPRYIEDLLDRDQVTIWREDDAIKAAENRVWASEKRALKRKPVAAKTRPASDKSDEDDARFKLKGWAEFERDGPLG